MLHSAVVKSDRDTTKVSFVYDASSKGKGQRSQNDCLMSGSPLNPKILGVILQFREHDYAFSSNIEGVFLKIGIDEDRDNLRFFWFPDENDSKYLKSLRLECLLR
ncbi:reverse transcriptase domain-containing protein [Nephila pilipes]|uniref:Reverse transcriptase domain-containing protein n=1 Tax=Nephila pilipes TaxID=299642 RepID=A0A8X6QQN7_NEPPI|nr:reverse transcriptase domain-containing protein [Nephila pilipes]